MEHTIITGQELRTWRDRDGNEHTMLRGGPIGDKIDVWTWDELVPHPYRKKARRLRQYVKAMYCPEGWYSESGGINTPFAGGALCSTMLGKWLSTTAGVDGLGLDAFKEFHLDHPVVWKIKVTQHSRTATYRYCDAELPASYRPMP